VTAVLGWLNAADGEGRPRRGHPAPKPPPMSGDDADIVLGRPDVGLHVGKDVPVAWAAVTTLTRTVGSLGHAVSPGGTRKNRDGSRVAERLPALLSVVVFLLVTGVTGWLLWASLRRASSDLELGPRQRHAVWRHIGFWRRASPSAMVRQRYGTLPLAPRCLRRFGTWRSGRDAAYKRAPNPARRHGESISPSSAHTRGRLPYLREQ
jgi:hypothetical protein